MIVLVSENIQIPHRCGKYSFIPYCEVPDDFGNDIIKASPKAYREIKKEEIASLDLSKWKLVDSLRGKSLKDAILLLNAEQEKKVLEFVKFVLNPPIPMLVKEDSFVEPPGGEAPPEIADEVPQPTTTVNPEVPTGEIVEPLPELPKVKTLEEMDVEELRGYAVANNIIIPHTMKKQETILAFIKENTKEV
jgi:hypothetical protein